MNDDRVLDALQRAFASGDDDGARADCPTGDDLWRAFHGEAPADARRRVVGHLAVCGACAADWGLLRARGPAAGPAPAPAVRRRRWRLPLSVVAAAAAVACVVLLARGPLRPGGPAPAPEAERSAARGLEILPLAGTDTLPRDGAVLRWTDLGPGALYAVDVAAADLALLARARGLARPEYALAPGALAAVPAGGVVVWRVEAVLPDGRRVASEGFRARVR